MRKKILASLFLIILLLTTAAASVFSYSAPVTTIEQDRERLKQQQQDYALAKSQRQQIQNQINTLLNENNSVLDQKNYVEYEIGYLIAEIDALSKLIEMYDGEIEKLNVEIDKINVDIDTYVALIGDIIKYNYLEGEPSVFEMLLSSESITGFLSKIQFASYMVDYNEKLIDELDNAVNKLDKSKAEHELASDKLSALIGENTTLKEEYEIKKVELEEKSKELLNNIKQTEQAYQRQQAEELLIQQQIAALQKQIKEKEVYQGNWARPLPYSVKRISSDYGNRILFGQQEFHNGIDFPAPIGTQIFAVQTGTVVIAEYNERSYGWYVVIDHGGGISTLYGHASQLSDKIAVGQKVLKGTVIAYVGSTGRSTGPHLHLGLMKNGQWINPETPGYLDINGMGFYKDSGA